MSERTESSKMKAARLLALSGRAQAELNAALEKLHSAGNWGIWDIIGGGFISTMVKHSRIDDAKHHLSLAEPMLHQLASELREFHLSAAMQTQIGGIATFADFFFDGILADLFVQSKIRDMESEVWDVLNQLKQVDNALFRLQRYDEM